MATQIKLRRDTAANWDTANPVLALGEPGYDTTNNKLKVGNGTDTWSQLSYLTDNLGSGTPGADGAAGADALWNWLGEYSAGPQYQPGDIVSYLGSTYRRNAVGNSVVGEVPTNLTYWQVVSEKGDAGGGGGNSNELVNGSKTVSLGTDGNLTFADAGGTFFGNGYLQSGTDGTNIGIKSWDGRQKVFVNETNVTVQTIDNSSQAYNWVFNKDGAFTFPSGAGFGLGESGQLKVNDGTTVSLDLRDTIGRGLYTNDDGLSLRGNGNNTWLFGTDGSITLPQGGVITETAAPLGAAKSLDLHPGNPGYPNQYLKIYPTVGGVDADHLHLTSGDLTATELFLGDDEQYVKLTNTGNVEIRTGAFDYYNDTKGVWTFDSDGVLTLPTHNNTPGSRIKSAVDITIETGPYYLVDLANVGSGSSTGIGTLDFLISSAPDWETKVAVGDHVVSGTWTDIITVVAPAGDINRWTVTFASGEFTGNDSKWSFYKPGAAGGVWLFGTDGVLTLPLGGDIVDSTGTTVLGGGSNSYAPDNTDNWNEPTVTTIQSALDELAARVTAFENFEIDGGNAYTPEVGELLIDGYGA